MIFFGFRLLKPNDSTEFNSFFTPLAFISHTMMSVSFSPGTLCLIPTASFCMFSFVWVLLLPVSVLLIDPVTYPTHERCDSLWYLTQALRLWRLSPVSLSHLTFLLYPSFFFTLQGHASTQTLNEWTSSHESVFEHHSWPHWLKVNVWEQIKAV